MSLLRGKRAIGGALVAVALCAVTCSSASAQTASARSKKAPTPAGAPEAFTAWAKREMAAQGIPGMSVAVVENYKVSWAAGFGMSNVAKGRR